MSKQEDFSHLRILYLCDKEIFLHRTSRVRFHAVKAIEKHCQLIWSGPGWDNWDSAKTLDENIEAIYENKKNPDLIFCYKPFSISGFAHTKIPTCVSYNEMGTPSHPRSYTVKEIVENRVGLVICHHKNEMLYPEFQNLPCKMVNIPHSAEKTVFHDYHLEKKIDVLLVGAVHPERYPLRNRLYYLLLKIRVDPVFESYKIGAWHHPGGMHVNTYDDSQAIAFAKAINRAKICLTCSGRYHCRYGKYVEIPACHSLLMGDLPDEEEAFFKQFMAVIDINDSDQQIKDKILYYLTHSEEREALTRKGYEIARTEYTQECYAERFLKAVSDFLTAL